MLWYHRMATKKKEVKTDIRLGWAGLSSYLLVRRIPASLSWEEPKPCWTLIMTPHHIRLLLLILAKL